LGGWAPTRGGVWGENAFEFLSKNVGFYALQKTILVARNRDPEGEGAEDVKCMAGG